MRIYTQTSSDNVRCQITKNNWSLKLGVKQLYRLLEYSFGFFNNNRTRNKSEYSFSHGVQFLGDEEYSNIRSEKIRLLELGISVLTFTPS